MVKGSVFLELSVLCIVFPIPSKAETMHRIHRKCIMLINVVCKPELLGLSNGALGFPVIS
jgi:hypothetical protein